MKEFSLDRVTASAAIFDFEKLYWLNRHYIKHTPTFHLVFLAVRYFSDAEFFGEEAKAKLKEVKAGLGVEKPEFDWLAKIIELFVPSVDRIDQLPERAALIFAYDAKAALAAPDNTEVLGWEKTRAVVQAFAKRVPEGAMTVEEFKSIVNEVKAETGAKGKELYHPIRLAITGSHSGPEFDKLIPILEEGSRLPLPKHVKSVRERVEEFLAVLSSK